MLDIQIPYKGSDYLYGGITQGAQGLASGIEQMTSHLKKAKAMRAMAVDAMGMDPEAVDKMSLPELEGHFQAIAVKNQMAQTQSMIEDRQAQAEERRARASELLMRNEEADALPQLMQNLNDQPNDGPNPADLMSPGAAAAGIGPGPSGHKPITMDRIVEAMSKMGATNPRLGAALARQIMPQITGAATMEPKFFRSPAGNPYVTYNHTMMPDKNYDPSNVTNQTVPIFDENGNVIGRGLPNGKGGLSPAPKEKQPEPLPSVFFSQLHEMEKDLALANKQLSLKDSTIEEQYVKGKTGIFKSVPEARASYTAEAERAKKAMADHLAVYESEGKGKPATFEMLRKKYGLLAPTATQPAVAGMVAPKKVTTKEEFDALPNGATYIGKDGITYRKP